MVSKDITVNKHSRLSSITLRLQKQLNEQLILTKDTIVNEHNRLSNITLRHIKVKEQLVVRQDMDVNERIDCPTLHLDTN